MSAGGGPRGALAGAAEDGARGRSAAESSPEVDGTLGHPLQTLELTVWMPVGWRGGGARDEFQSYADKIFPNRYRDKEIFLVRYPAHWWTS